MNPNNSETAEMLKKLIVACLAGLEAACMTHASLAIDGALPRVAAVRKSKVPGAPMKNSLKIRVALHMPQRIGACARVLRRQPRDQNRTWKLH
jgi:hypothetical protein